MNCMSVQMMSDLPEPVMGRVGAAITAGKPAKHGRGHRVLQDIRNKLDPSNDVHSTPRSGQGQASLDSLLKVRMHIDFLHNNLECI